MACRLGDKGPELMVKKGQTVLADELGKALDQVATPIKSSKTAVCRRADVAPRHGQDVVVDTAGNAFSVRVHLARHLHVNQRVSKLEEMVADLKGQVDTQQSLLRDMRREKFVTQGAFTAALLCKADGGMVKSQRWKLDLICKLLISAGILDDDTDGDGLCVREQEESKPSAVQQPGYGNDRMAYVEELITHAEEEIARVEKVAVSATTEAQRAVATAAEASERSEKATTQGMHVDERCQQVEQKCRQADDKRQRILNKCYDRLDNNLEENRQRIETNSTRIFHLATEVEGLAKSIQERNKTATPLASPRVETGEVFPVELANLPPKQQRTGETTAATAAVLPQQRQEAIEIRRSEGKSQNHARATRTRTHVDLEETHEEPCESRSGGDQDHRAPCRPGVLDEPSPEGRTDIEADSICTAHSAPCRPEVLDEPSPEVLTNTEADSIRTAFLAARLMQAAPPRPRHSTYVGRRAAMFPGRKDAGSPLVVGPVRPQEDRPTANQEAARSWARASSWPLLASEAPVVAPAAAARQPHDLKADREPTTSTDADAVAEENSLVRRGDSTPSLDVALAHGGLPRHETTKLTPEGEAPPGGAVPASDPSSIASGADVDGMIICSPLHGRTKMTGDHADDDMCSESLHDNEHIARSAHRNEDLSKQHQGTARKEIRQPPLSPPQRLEEMTRKEAAGALLGASVTVMTRRSLRDRMGTDFDSLSARTDSPGTRLARLGDTPELWCPRDTWDDNRGALGSSSSDGSSTEITAVAGGWEGGLPRPEPPMTGRNE